MEFLSQKKADLLESTIGKWVIALALLLILILIVAATKDKFGNLWNQIKNILRFR